MIIKFLKNVSSIKIFHIFTKPIYKLLPYEFFSRFTLHASRFTLHFSRLTKLNYNTVAGCIALLCFNVIFSQASVPISLSWSTQVGCQSYDSLEDRDKKTVFIEDIIDGKCLRICENSAVTYTLNGDLGNNPMTNWIATGGIVTNQTNTQATIAWSNAGQGTISFDMVSDTKTIRKTICIEILNGPAASFDVLIDGLSIRDGIKVCANVPINFTNTSITNGGTAITDNYWRFIYPAGGTTAYSNALSPNYSFPNPGTYQVELTVTNACNCKSTFMTEVEVIENGVTINYPSMVCENSQGIYSLSDDSFNQCGGNYNWTVVNGASTFSSSDYPLNVLWDQVDEDGFGYVTFNPVGCNMACSVSTTIKVPVIKKIGTIKGDLIMCKNQQGRYKLPQWPTTNFTWSIDGNAGTVIPTDQRNEVIITPTQSGMITLRATYQNTLLHCVGTAELTIYVKETITFVGNQNLCLNQTGSYSTQGNIPVNWTLKKMPEGLVLATLPNSTNFTYNSFSQVGNYELSATGPNICDNQNINISVAPSIDAPLVDNPKLVVCPNAPTVYKILNQSTPSTQYVWEVVGGTFVGSNIGFEVTVKFTTNGFIRVKRVTSPNQCSSTFTAHAITLDQINAGLSDLPSNVPATNMTACQSSYVNYKAVNSSAPLSLYTSPSSTYEWSIVPSSAGSITTGQGSNNVQVLWNNVPFGLPSITASLRCTIKRCTLTSSFVSNVTVYSSPIFTVVAPNSVCSGVGISFSLSPPLPAGSSVFWTFSDGSSFTAAGNLPTPPKVFYNGSTFNANYTATASFSNAFGCPGTYTGSKNFVVTPGPFAVLAASGNTTFCDPNTINTVLTPNFVAGATIQWYKNNTALGGTTSSTSPLTLNGSSGFGEYYFIANQGGCLNRSNSVFINQNCGPGPSCNPPTPAMTLVYDGVNSSNCRTLSLTGTAAGIPLNTFFTIQGPNFPLISAAGSGVSPSTISRSIQFAGIYNCTFNARYSSVCTFTKNLDVAVPYVPYFFTNVVCNANNTFTIALLDSSSILAGTSNMTYLYYYRLVGSSTWSGPVSPPNGTTTATLNNLPQGNYEILQRVQGVLNGTTYPACDSYRTRNLVGFANQTIVFNQPNCYNDVVNFSTSNPQSGTTYLWTFDEATASTNSQPAPGKVFDPASAETQVPVSVVVTNIYGCQMTLNVLVNIPKQCFKGIIIADPPNATVCRGNAVTIKYKPFISTAYTECTPDLYILMDDTTQIQTSTVNNFSVTTPGFYWIKVINYTPNDYECVWNTTQRIAPTFTTPPSLTLNVPAVICANDGLSCSVQTDPPGTVQIRWFLNNNLQTNFNDLDSFSHDVFEGVYTVKVIITNPTTGCSTTDTKTVEVLAAPSDLDIAAPVLIDCESYEIQLDASCSQPGNYLWSNGMTGANITIYSGGPYKVTITNAAGCSMQKEIDVPRKPDHYMWIYPQGAYELCAGSYASLIGPNVVFNQWKWNLFGSAMLTGFNSKPTPYIPSQNGTYNLELNTGLCPVPSPDMYVTLTSCPNCIKDAIVHQIYAAPTNYCSYIVNAQLINDDPSAITLSFISNNKVIIAPTVFVPADSQDYYSLSVTPINGFLGGPLTIQAVGILANGEKCFNNISFELPMRNNVITNKANNSAKKDKISTMVLYPNPAQSQVTVQFESIADKAVIEVYDLTGRLVATHNATSLKEEWQLDLNPLQAALYVVVMKENGQIVMQRKLEVVK